MQREWRREPPGKGYEATVINRPTINAARFRQDFLEIEEEEFVAAMRQDGASEHMIEQELVLWRPLKAQREERLKSKKRKVKEVSQELEPYVEAEARRLAKGVPDEEEETDV